ncbi:hypothetical protein FBQ97_04745 [Acidobacteria bacterium ACD]|nr:MAG: hypothetical protein EDX89_13365 [Acidobacteriota bacterium]MDL1949108.1 hypothetical protein [Acidobacteria bacterium ACD]
MSKESIVIRELRTPEEFRATEEISKAAWRFSDRAVPPAADLVAATRAGGLTAGAFARKQLVAFVHSIPRVNLGQPAQHSHLLAVQPSLQGLGISARLKFFQRSWCLERRIRLVTWTYDPFLLRNARLNVGRLRATVRGLVPNLYGPLGGIYGGLPTDRFEVTWRLDDPIVELAARGEALPTHAPEDDQVPVARPLSIPDAPRVALPFPAGAPGIYRTDPAGSLRARKAFGKVARTLFDRGYEVTGLMMGEAGPAYLLDRR